MVHSKIETKTTLVRLASFPRTPIEKTVGAETTHSEVESKTSAPVGLFPFPKLTRTQSFPTFTRNRRQGESCIN